MHPLWQVVSNQDNKSAYDHITVFIELRSFCATAQIQLCCNRFLFQHDTIFVHKARSIKKLSPQFVVDPTPLGWPEMWTVSQGQLHWCCFGRMGANLLGQALKSCRKPSQNSVGCCNIVLMPIWFQMRCSTITFSGLIRHQAWLCSHRLITTQLVSKHQEVHLCNQIELENYTFLYFFKNKNARGGLTGVMQICNVVCPVASKRGLHWSKEQIKISYI